MGMTKIETYLAGYPRYTALISAYSPYFVFRRFSRLRARLLLSKQDELTVLEQKLDDIDKNEPRRLFLGKLRNANNQDRTDILSEVLKHLSEYDDLVQKTRQILSVETAQKRDISSLQNWLAANACITREESAYLEHEADLMSLGSVHDDAVHQLEIYVEDHLVPLFPSLSEKGYRRTSENEHVYIYSGSLIRNIARLLLLSIVTVLLMLPVILCSLISTASIRIVVVMLSTVSYLFILSGLTRSRTMALILAGATYVTILTVFVSGTNGA